MSFGELSEEGVKMSTLQEQSDVDFVAQDTIAKEMAAEEAGLVDRETKQEVQYADEGADDYPAPPALQSDGKPLKQASSKSEYADAESNSGVHGGEPPAKPQRPERRDVHTGDDASAESEYADELVARAMNYGLTENDIRSRFSSQEELEEALLGIDRDTLSSFEQFQRQQQMQQRFGGQQPVAPQPQQQPQQPPIPPGQEPTHDQWGRPYRVANPEIYEEELLKDLTGISEHTMRHISAQQQELQQLRQTVGQMAQHQQWEAKRRETVEFDRQIQDLGAEWQELFGAGEADALRTDSPEMRNRANVYQTALQMRWLGQQQGRRVSLKDVLPSALSHHFPKQKHHSHAQPRTSKGLFTARPNRRSSGKQSRSREELLSMWDNVGGDSEKHDGI
jgi:hypothetical protein